MKIGIIGAMNAEVNLLLNSLDNVKELTSHNIKVYKANINNNEIFIVMCGMGKVNAGLAASILAIEYGCELIINSGIAGGVAPLKTKDIIIGKELAYNDVDACFFGYKYGQVPQMPESYSPKEEDIKLVKESLDKLGLAYKEAKIYSGDQFVTSFEQLKNVEGDGYAVEMEGAAVAQTCYRLGVRFIVLRFISDIVGAPSQITDYPKFENQMAEASASICLNVLRSL